MLALLIPLIAFVLLVTVLVKRGMILSWSARDIDEMIPYVTSIDESLAHFRELLGAEFRGTDKQGWRQKRQANDDMLRETLGFLGKFDDNSRLFGELARHEIRLIFKPEGYGDYGLTVECLQRGAGICRLLVLVAQMLTGFWLAMNSVAWFLLPQQSQLLQSCCQRLLNHYGEIRGLALSLASRHGEHYYDNLLSAL